MFLSISATFAQKRTKQKPAAKPKPIVFAVLNDGQSLEPIGEVDKGKSADKIDGAISNILFNF